MLTVHLLTKNNAKTITKALDSVRSHATRILVADLGSQDNTIEICQNLGAEVHRLSPPRDQARNILIAQSQEGLNLMIEPWEAVMQGLTTQTPGLATIVEQKIVTKEDRLWIGSRFVNPVYERLEPQTDVDSGLVIYSSGRSDQLELLQEVQEWKAASPTAKLPYYFEACLHLSLGNWQSFLPLAEHYMFLDRSSSIPSIMCHYYYALVHVLHVKRLQPAMQNISICLATHPLMAEFWCLLGDIHYHLNHRFESAKQFYENAMIMGSRRAANDRWPMDIAKYKAYPNKMIKSCDQLISQTSLYASKKDLLGG